MSPTDIQFEVEKQFLRTIVELSKAGTLDEERVRLSAKVLMAMRPWQSLEEAVLKTEFFTQKFPEFKAMHTYVATLKDEQNIKSAIDAMHAHLQNADIDKALEVAKQYE